jgi:putative FmdB family regulatory protein
MPTYEYECQACGRQMEAVQRITEPPLVDCPACNQPRLQRLISGTSFILKGGGWYKDGYGSEKKPRTENDRIDRMTKAIEDDKKKTAAAESSSPGTSDASPSSGASSTPAPSSGGGSSDS